MYMEANKILEMIAEVHQAIECGDEQLQPLEDVLFIALDLVEEET